MPFSPSPNKQQTIEELENSILGKINKKEEEVKNLVRKLLNNLSKNELEDVPKLNVFKIWSLIHLSSRGLTVASLKENDWLNNQNHFIALCRLMMKNYFSASQALAFLEQLNCEELFQTEILALDPKYDLPYRIDAIVALMKNGEYSLEARTAVKILSELTLDESIAIKKIDGSKFSVLSKFYEDGLPPRYFIELNKQNLIGANAKVPDYVPSCMSKSLHDELSRYVNGNGKFKKEEWSLFKNDLGRYLNTPSHNYMFLQMSPSMVRKFLHLKENQVSEFNKQGSQQNGVAKTARISDRTCSSEDECEKVLDYLRSENLNDDHIRVLIRLIETQSDIFDMKKLVGLLKNFTPEAMREIKYLGDQEVLLLAELQCYGLKAHHFYDNADWFRTENHFNALRNLLKREKNPLDPTEALSILEDLSDSKPVGAAYSGYKLEGIEQLSDEAISLWREEAVKDTGLVAKHFNDAKEFEPVAHRVPFIYLVKKIYNEKGHEGSALKFGDQIHQRAKEKFQREVIKSACEKYLAFRNQDAPGSRLGRFSYWAHGSSGIKRVEKLKTTIESMEELERVKEDSDHGKNAEQINKLAKKAYSKSGKKKNSFTSYFDKAVEEFETDTKTFFRNITDSDALPFLMDESWDSFKQEITSSQKDTAPKMRM